MISSERHTGGDNTRQVRSGNAIYTSSGQESQLHWINFSWQAHHLEGGGDDEEGFDGAGWQRSVHRLR